MSDHLTETGQPTPGPWKAEPFRVQVQTTNGMQYGPLMSYLAGNKATEAGMTVSIASERVADHHLCAAAPDLLAVLLVAYESNLGADWEWPHTAKETWLKGAGEAIAKARGEKP